MKSPGLTKSGDNFLRCSKYSTTPLIFAEDFVNRLKNNEICAIIKAIWRIIPFHICTEVLYDCSITNADIQNHLKRKARSDKNPDGLGEKTLTNIKAFLNLIFKQAMVNGYILRNPVTGVKIPKSGTKESRALTVEEQHRLLDVARDYPRPIIFAVIFANYRLPKRRSLWCAMERCFL